MEISLQLKTYGNTFINVKLSNAYLLYGVLLFDNISHEFLKKRPRRRLRREFLRRALGMKEVMQIVCG
jgi:hypothetical protein